MRALMAFAVALFATTVWAGPMMLPGPSPESGLKGVWRFIGAEIGPWAKPRKLAKADAPFLEYAVDFEDGEVKGPAPLACKGAKYQSGVSYHGEAFGGRLAADKDGALAKKIALSDPEISTYRVTCGSTARDYYMDDHADMKFADGDVVYTLERPTGMDVGQYQAGFSGPSFDCTKAKSTGEKLICGDAGLAASDKKLGAAYLALKKSLSAENFATFQVGQRAWIAYAMKSCGADAPAPDAGTVTECLKTEYDSRAELLERTKVYRAGALTIEPLLRFRMRANPATEESDIYPQMRGGPEAAAFNAFILKTLKLDRWRMDDKSLFRYGDDVNGMKLHAHRFYSVGRFDDRILSLFVTTSDFVGGHDEEGDYTIFTWGVRAGRPLSLDDMFAKGADWKKFVLGYCTRDLQQQIRRDGVPGDLASSELPKQLADGAHWSWDKDKAVLSFTIFMDSGMPESVYDVTIPYKTLKPYLKPDAPVL
jgi:uncharacterized protein YecT (DUF1311 family)